MTSILQDPYLMQKSTPENGQGNDLFYGFCKDLIELIAKQMRIKCEYYFWVTEITQNKRCLTVAAYYIY